MFDEIRQKTAALNEQIAILRKEAASMVKPMLSEFVKANPQVKAVKWSQYTPYFNDGEQCIFRVNEPAFYFEGDDLEEEGHELWSFGKDHGPQAEQCSQETATACAALACELGGLEDALQELFGDHVEVIVTGEGVSVDEYEHD